MAATGGLSQILQYSDSSEDENADKPDTVIDNECTEKEPEGKRSLADREGLMDNKTTVKKRRLELPSAVLSMFGGHEEEKQEEPSLHQGRVRSFAHERGNWATYVYFPVDRDVVMQNLVDDLIQALPSSSEWHQMASLHLSLSRTVVVFHHWINELMSALTTSLSPHTPFDCLIGAVEVYTNDEKTRTFLGLQITTGHSELESLVHVVDRCLAEFQLQEYYKNPSFHVSVAWMLGDVTDKITPRLKETIQEILANHIMLNPALGSIETSRVEAKCGNKCFSFTLNGS